MKDADNGGKSEEVRVRLDKHPLYLIQFTASCSALLFGGFRKTSCHCGEQVELPVAHGLEDNLERQRGRRCIDFDVLGSEMPEVIWEYDRLVEALRAGFVAFGENRDIYDMSFVRQEQREK